jgi:DNA repair protein RecO (recombination protein O)
VRHGGGERLYRASAVVLRRVNLGETDRIVTLFTREHGKLNAVAKGARGPRSRVSGATEPFTRFDALLAVGQSLDVLTQAQVTAGGGPLRADLQRVGYASHFLELVDGATEERQPAPELWALLVEALEVLETARFPAALCRAFELQAVTLLGYEPELSGCVVGEHPLAPDDPAFFHPTRGGAVCPECAAGAPGFVRLSPATVPAMRKLQQMPLATCGAEELPPGVPGELARCLIAYLRYHLEAPLRSLHYLESLR